MMRPDRFPLTYDECRERFRWTVAGAGLSFDSYPIAARGPFGTELTIDVTSFGVDQPRRVLLVLAGVHGDEGFSSSTLMCDAVERWAGRGWARAEDLGRRARDLYGGGKAAERIVGAVMAM